MLLLYIFNINPTMLNFLKMIKYTFKMLQQMLQDF